MSLKEQARERLIVVQNKVLALSHQMHAHPETSMNEKNACLWIGDLLEEQGFTVQRGVSDLPTAFIATAGTGKLHIAFCTEYDALPEIGHACGHNINGAASIGAGIAAAAIADAADLTISVIGTPGEEAGGGKIQLLEKGIFQTVHAAMMVHAAPLDVLNYPTVALQEFQIDYLNEDEKQDSNPEDALIIAQASIGLLRRYLDPSDRINGIIINNEINPESIPHHTAAKYIVRSATFDRLQVLEKKVLACFEGAAIATGTKLKVTFNEKAYANLNQDQEILSLYKENAEALGRTFIETSNHPHQWQLKLINFILKRINISMPDAIKMILKSTPGSTDMGNVSLALPSIHPAIGIGSSISVNVHDRKFVPATITKEADQAIFDSALTMAWTAIDIANNEKIRNRLLTFKN